MIVISSEDPYYCGFTARVPQYNLPQVLSNDCDDGDSDNDDDDDDDGDDEANDEADQYEEKQWECREQVEEESRRQLGCN